MAKMFLLLLYVLFEQTHPLTTQISREVSSHFSNVKKPCQSVKRMIHHYFNSLFHKLFSTSTNLHTSHLLIKQFKRQLTYAN